RIDRSVPSDEFARRTDQHLPGSPRLDVECDRLRRHRVSARQISKLDQLVPAESRIPVRDDEMSLAWYDGNAGSELGHQRTGCVDHAVARDPFVAGNHFTRADCVYTNALPQAGPVVDRTLQQRPRTIRRIDDRIAAHEQGTSQSGSQMRFGFGKLRWG